MTPSYEDIADYLVSVVSLGLVKTPPASANLFGGNLPNSPDDATAVYEQTGFESEMVMGGLDHDPLNIQVIVRDTKATEGRDRAFAIRDALVDFNYLPPANRTLGGKLYLSIIPRSAPFSIGKDENNRTKWSCNYITRVKIL